jgi:hypothetical protein
VGGCSCKEHRYVLQCCLAGRCCSTGPPGNHSSSHDAIPGRYNSREGPLASLHHCPVPTCAGIRLEVLPYILATLDSGPQQQQQEAHDAAVGVKQQL